MGKKDLRKSQTELLRFYLRVKNNGVIENNGKKTTGAPDCLSDRRREWP